jgi:hypothetical protein
VLNANSLTGTLYTGTPPGSHQQVNLDPTAHPHVVKKQGETVGHLPAGTVIGPVPDHAHDVEKRIPTGQPAPASITLTINGVSLSSGASVQGTRDPLLGNAFTSAFVANDISVEMEAAGRPGSVVPLRFDAGTSAGNPFGVGFLQISVTAVEELGGLASTFRAS